VILNIPDNLASLPEAPRLAGRPLEDLVTWRLAGLGVAELRRLGGLRAGHRRGGPLQCDGGSRPPQPLRPRLYRRALRLRGSGRSRTAASPAQLDEPAHGSSHTRSAWPWSLWAHT